MEAAAETPSYMWWDQNGGSVPELQTVACLVTSQPASASICERINSEFEFVKDRRRNRLSHEKANKLVSLFHNLRLLKRMKKPQYSEPMIAWGDSEELDVASSRVTKFLAAGSSSGGPSKLLAAQKKEPVKKDPLPLLPSV